MDPGPLIAELSRTQSYRKPFAITNGPLFMAMRSNVPFIEDSFQWLCCPLASRETYHPLAERKGLGRRDNLHDPLLVFSFSIRGLWFSLEYIVIAHNNKLSLTKVAVSSLLSEP